MLWIKRDFFFHFRFFGSANIDLRCDSSSTKKVRGMSLIYVSDVFSVVS